MRPLSEQVTRIGRSAVVRRRRLYVPAAVLAGSALVVGHAGGLAWASSFVADGFRPLAQRGERPAKSRRQPPQIAQDLDRHLARYQDAQKRRDQAAVRRASDDLRQASAAALTDREGQLHGASSPVYWAATIARDAAATGDDLSLQRARRYLAGYLRAGSS